MRERLRTINTVIGLLFWALAIGSFYMQFAHPFSERLLHAYAVLALLSTVVIGIGVGLAAGILSARCDGGNEYVTNPIFMKFSIFFWLTAIFFWLLRSCFILWELHHAASAREISLNVEISSLLLQFLVATFFFSRPYISLKLMRERLRNGENA